MFRFTIRELVLLTAVVALACGWWLEHRGVIAPLAKLAEYEAAEQRELERQAAEKKKTDLLWKLHATKAVNEYGAPSPGGAKGPDLTNEERRELIKLIGGR
jgi:hypothetical protein